MSETQVDLSQIRGDWNFHINYLNNAVQQTLKRANALWPRIAEQAGDGAVGDLLEQQTALWRELNDQLDEKGALPVTSDLLDRFVEVTQQTKAPCDALEEAEGAGGSSSTFDTTLEQFTEAMRQVRSFCEDLTMMRGQKPY